MHERFLRLALEQAYLGRGRCAPNPSVGAVAVFENRILAVGFHQGPGTAHAEQVVISALPPQLQDVTLYVTLEPCNHWGRTPPCVEAIIQYGIKRVVYGFSDPNPIVAEKDSPAYLRAHGAEVCFYPLPEIHAFYESYAHWIKTGRPWISAKLAVSLDGSIAGTEGARVWLSNEACQVFTHRHRQMSDVILTTAKTILSDDPLLNARVGEGTLSKKIAILDRTRCLPKTVRCVEAAEQVLIFHDEKARGAFHHERGQYVPMKTKDQGLDLENILDHLGKMGAHDVWVEAGGTLFTALHLAGLVQRTFLYLTPHVLGEGAINAYRDKAVFQRQHSVSWRVLGDNALLVLDW